MKTLYFIRHGYAVHNKLFKCLGSAVYQQLRDTHLVYEGVKQAKELGRTWDKINDVELVVTSPCSRTLETTMHIFHQIMGKPKPRMGFKSTVAVPHNDTLPVIAKDFLIEFPMGTDICNRRLDVTDLTYLYPSIDFSEMGDDVLPWGTECETVDALNMRIKKMLEWVNNRPEKTIAIVAHSSYISQYLEGRIGNEDDELLHCHPYEKKIGNYNSVFLL